MDEPIAALPVHAGDGAAPPVDVDVILDVDTGLDDALALLLAFRVPGVRVLGVTCVDGNVGVDQVVANTLGVLEVAGAPAVPVARGCPAPLAARTHDAAWVHGRDGLGGIALPATTRRPSGVHAVELLRRLLTEARRPVTVVALAPLTNLAVLLTCHPELKERIARLVVMGGSAAAGGNDEPAAEFNVAHDPEAADVVLRAGVDTTLYGLDVFTTLTVDGPGVERLRGAGAPAARLAGELLSAIRTSWGSEEACLGDAGALAAALWPAGATVTPHPTVVELHGTHTRGATVVDRRPRAAWAPYNDRTWPVVGITWAIDTGAYRDRFLRAITAPAPP